MSDGATGPRLLIRQLHQIMAGQGTAQSRLDRVVRLIAGNMVTEVCSIYLLRAGRMLELFATEGLKQTAVHRTRLKVGEGLVGHIADTAVPLNLTEARDHPFFVYKPETGEEIYHSLLGVPIVRSGMVLGVLVVQNRTSRRYQDEDVEALQTVAMVLAELVAAGELIDLKELEEGAAPKEQQTLDGQSLAEGIAMGQAVLHEPKIEVTRMVAENLEEELKRFSVGLEAMRAQLGKMMAATDVVHAGEHRDVLETYMMFAHDRGWQEKIQDAIQSGLTAEAAVERVQQRTRTRFAEVTDPYLKERLADMDDLAHRLVRFIQAGGAKVAHGVLNGDSIVIAEAMGPADLLDYDRRFLKGVVLEQGSPNSHVSIVARAMGVPILGRIEHVLEDVREGDMVIVDADTGHLLVRPTDDVVKHYSESIALRAERAAAYEAERDLKAETRDGHRVRLLMNAGLTSDLAYLDKVGAEGIGLFRTEFQFLVSKTMPRADAQREIYLRAYEAAGDKPIVFRTLDVGGDKAVPFIPRIEEENPALGWRALRIGLDHPALLRYQVRALLQASVGRQLNILFPMVADVPEYLQARAIVDQELAHAERFKHELPSEIRYGVMLEVPSLAFQMKSLLPVVDFISIGTNDLLQFFFACDRGNPKLVNRYDLLSPAVLSLLRGVAMRAAEAHVPVTLCGEMGGRPLEAMALIGIGIDGLSISPAAIGPVKAMIRSLDYEKLRDFIVPLLEEPKHSLREDLKAFARDHDVVL